ncbi:MAG: biotin/lipoyl-containing protein [Chloroflexota bacterium]|nr:MAG: acetyl-CoA carboxylase biotin carboxyl carrier protein subunit [Bellilinea sp.]
MKLNVKINDQTFEVEIADLNARPILATVDGETFEVYPEEAGQPAVRQATPAAPAPAPAAAAPAPVSRAAAPVNASKALTAPLPGTVVAVLVKEGSEVKYGQELLTIEAMKMKNAIRATRDGKIAAIYVKEGDSVRHGQALLEYAD